MHITVYVSRAYSVKGQDNSI